MSPLQSTMRTPSVAPLYAWIPTVLSLFGSARVAMPEWTSSGLLWDALAARMHERDSSIWKPYANLVVNALQLLLTCNAQIADAYASAGLIDQAALSGVGLRGLFATAFGLDSITWESEFADFLNPDDQNHFLSTCERALSDFVTSGRPVEVVELTLIELIHELSDLMGELWRKFLRDPMLLSFEEMAAKRAVHTRKYVEILRRHVVVQGALTDGEHVQQYLRSLAAVGQLDPALGFVEDSPRLVPIIISHHDKNLGYFDRPDTPNSVVPPTRSPSITTSMFSEPFWSFGGHLEADEDASIMGIMSPASVNSEGITPGIRERRDVFARGLLDPAVGSRRHLIVFVHGMLGSRWDFQLYRNKILLARHNLGLPATDLCFLTSTSNEDDTFDDIGTLADNLVAEILEFVDSQVVDIDRMSFVCHSLGGLIARAAIEKPGMRVFHDIFHTFTTFATPHLSIAMTDNRILSLLGKAYLLFEKSPCVEQVLLRDASDKHDCFLYRQAHSTQALERFKKICLFASAQDGYAGLGSALVADIAHGRVGSSSRKSERRAAACSVGGACEILRFGGGGVSAKGRRPLRATPGSSPLSLASPDNSSTGNDAPPPAALTVSEAYDEMLSALEAGMARVKVERYKVWWPGLAGKMDALGRAAHIAMLQDEALSELATAIGRYYM
ncbi:hypothetical protein HDU89_006059 [Geranomyces variabilis]|nr:hypothetical protein HDU89_006059 [Geranomyces variabilis]